MVNSPDDYTAALGTLIEYKQRSWPNAHFCFMGCGGDETADQYVYMVISAWLQKHMAYVSLARGGYSGSYSCPFDWIYLLLQHYTMCYANHCPQD